MIKSYKEGENMKKLNIGIKELTYYLVSLFFLTECKYSCTSTKIGKMLSILAFKYAYNGFLLFNDEVRKYDNCGTMIESSACWLHINEYVCRKDQNNKEYITEELKEPIDLPAKINCRYIEIFKCCDLPFYVKKEVEEVFRYFGAYSHVDLSEVLNPIVDMLTTESYGKIDLSKISYIIDEVTQDNEVIKYLKSNPISNEIINDVQVKRKIMKII